MCPEVARRASLNTHTPTTHTHTDSPLSSQRHHQTPPPLFTKEKTASKQAQFLKRKKSSKPRFALIFKSNIKIHRRIGNWIFLSYIFHKDCLLPRFHLKKFSLIKKPFGIRIFFTHDCYNKYTAASLWRLSTIYTVFQT